MKTPKPITTEAVGRVNFIEDEGFEHLIKTIKCKCAFLTFYSSLPCEGKTVTLNCSVLQQKLQFLRG